MAENTEDQDEETPRFIVHDESCLGYLYPKKLDESTNSRTAAYGSKLFQTEEHEGEKGLVIC